MYVAPEGGRAARHFALSGDLARATHAHSRSGNRSHQEVPFPANSHRTAFHMRSQHNRIPHRTDAIHSSRHQSRDHSYCCDPVELLDRRQRFYHGQRHRQHSRGTVTHTHPFAEAAKTIHRSRCFRASLFGAATLLCVRSRHHSELPLDSLRDLLRVVLHLLLRLGFDHHPGQRFCA